MANSTSSNQTSVLLISLVGLIALWAIAGWLGGDPTILPGPSEVVALMISETQTGELPMHLWATLRRVAFAFSLAMLFGLIIGIAMGMNAQLNKWFGAWLVVLLNIPALVVIVLCYLWIGLNELAAVTAVALNKTAMVAVTIREGVHALDPKLTEMAKSFRMGFAARLRHIVLPQLWPFVAASTRNGLAIIWKIVLVVEFLGRSDGIGFQVHLYFQLFETAYVLAYALSFVVLMLLLEYVVVAPLEKRLLRWKTSGALA